MDARAGVKVTVAPSSVVVAPGGTAPVMVTTTVDPAMVTDGPHEGIITLQSTSGTLHVPYIFWRAGVEVPEQLSGMQTSTATLAAPGGTMDVRFNIGYGGVRPAVEAGEVPQGSSFASEVVATVTGTDGTTNFGTVYRRSLLLVGDHGFSWDGRDVHGNLFLTDGDYLLRTSVLESNNDPANLQISEAAHQSAPIHVTGMAGVPVLSLNIVGGSLREGGDVTVSLTADTTTSIAGIAAAVQFEPYYLSVKSVQEGDFLNQGEEPVELCLHGRRSSRHRRSPRGDRDGPGPGSWQRVYGHIHCPAQRFHGTVDWEASGDERQRDGGNDRPVAGHHVAVRRQRLGYRRQQARGPR